MRTGPNFLESSLNALEGVVSYGEAFNPHFVGKKDQLTLLGVSIAERDADPVRLLTAMRRKTAGLAGFRYFHDHDPRVLAEVMADASCAKVVLTRNPLESYVSWKIARQTGQWKLTDARKAKPVSPVVFDAVEFETHLDTLQTFQRRLLADLQQSGQTAFYLDYDDLGNVAVLNGLAAFLGAKGRLDAPDPTLKKQNPGDLAAKLANPDAVEPGLQRLDRFNLHRTPNFEPRRPPAIPSLVAGGGVLYMPVRGGPEARVRGWLSSLSTDGLEQDFTQKTLRQWWRAHPRHCSFTVLRHPLLRAYGAFCDHILTGLAGETRAILERTLGFDLPAGVDGFADRAAERDAFLAFLGYVRLNLAGQTGARVSPHWASQTAVLQGFAQVLGPDVVLREDRLDEGLAFVAAEAGHPGAPPPPGDDPHPLGLAAIHDVALEEAAEAAYPRDYLGFGFGRWKAD